MEFNAEEFRKKHYANKRVVIMGYGIYATGSGIAAAEYLAKAQANIIVMDLRSQDVLAENMARLSHYKNIEWKVGVPHDEADLKNADLVVKNPGVHRDSPYLQLAKVVESDISLFLREYHAMQESNQIKHHLVAITGSKGKSSTVSLLHHLLGGEEHKAFLAGNITVSPLFYLDRLSQEREATLILELSSWQLADLKGKDLLKPDIAMLTNLMSDHLNYYNNDMKAYAQDKENIFLEQDFAQYTLFDLSDPHTPYFISKAKAKQGFYHPHQVPTLYAHRAYWHDQNTLYLEQDSLRTVISINEIPPFIVKDNLAKALWIGSLLGLNASLLEDRLSSYDRGLPCRCEVIGKRQKMRFINDSAATIPEATISAIQTFKDPHRRLVLILGGADKGSDLSVLQDHLTSVDYVYLLQGSASKTLEHVLKTSSKAYQADCDNFSVIMKDFMERFRDEAVDLLLSPAVASFGLFHNEFDRGRAFNTAVHEIIDE